MRYAQIANGQVNVVNKKNKQTNETMTVVDWDYGAGALDLDLDPNQLV